MLTLLMRRAKEDGHITGILPHLMDDGLSIHQYADDATIFLDHNPEQAENMKLLLNIFEQMSGFKINFHFGSDGLVAHVVQSIHVPIYR